MSHSQHRAALGRPDRTQVQHELNGSMDRLLAVLSDKQREIVVLRVVVGLSAEETAGLVGSTPGAVRVAQHWALLPAESVTDVFSPNAS